MRRWACRATIASVILATAATARAEPDASIPSKISEKIVADLARADLEATSADSAKYMGQNAADNMKNSFASIKNLGQSQYTDLMYSRDFGQTSKDMIYKIDFDKAFVFVRFTWQVDSGNWRLVHLQFKSENELPFPTGWEHIYPK